MPGFHGNPFKRKKAPKVEKFLPVRKGKKKSPMHDRLSNLKERGMFGKKF